MDNINTIKISDQGSKLSTAELNNLAKLVTQIYKVNNSVIPSEKADSDIPSDNVKSAEVNLFNQAQSLAVNAIKKFNQSPKHDLKSVSHDLEASITISNTLNKMLDSDFNKLQNNFVSQLDTDIRLKQTLQKFFKTNIPQHKQYELDMQVSDFLTMQENDPMYKIVLNNLKQYSGLDKLALEDRKDFISTKDLLGKLSETISDEKNVHTLSGLLHKNYADILAKSGNDTKALQEYNEYLKIKNNPVSETLSIDPSQLGIVNMPKLLES